MLLVNDVYKIIAQFTTEVVRSCILNLRPYVYCRTCVRYCYDGLNNRCCLCTYVYKLCMNKNIKVHMQVTLYIIHMVFQCRVYI